MSETSTSRQPVAVIDIGSSAIRMIIAEVGAKSEIHYLENLQKPIAFGKDVFTTGRISNSLIHQGLEILKNYKTVIDGYNIKNLHAIATSAVREAGNRDYFVDQVFVRAGIEVEVIEAAEHNRLELVAVEHSLHGNFDFQKKNCLIIEVGSGSTEMIILNNGEVELTRTLPIGSIRLPEQAVAGKTSSEVVKRVLKRSIHDIAVQAAREYSLGDVDTFIALGGDMRFVSRQVAPQNGEARFCVLPNKHFLDFVDSVSKLSVDEAAQVFGLPYSEAETLCPSLLFYADFLGETKAQEVIIPMVSIRDGLLLELAQLLSGYKRTDLSRQVISSAKKLGKKYKYDEAHASCVASLSVKLFDVLKEDHGLSSRERLLLEVAATLHDIGTYISGTSHHKHSSYLIDASDIFGLRKSDKDIISDVARYHRRSTPQPSHVPYMSLPKSERVIVSKLAAILRVADALERGHQQKIRSFQLEKTEDSYFLWVPDDVGDISLEKDALMKKGMMFSEVFGSSIMLKQGNPPKG